ncbi:MULTISPECIES: MBL fold metallo-hydrolase [Agrobacterium]|uniref:MBL fold metallo-hydrolase n=1 Tax=Agrobacterium TaxID=357 RepID=UPI0013AF49C4|nr:MBL fold metallo-hydrolase [Agrobacterium tumefaciens]NSZ07356.1 MBL fold metallo-hydrolase [Agrobacterium tumefaciens]
MAVLERRRLASYTFPMKRRNFFRFSALGLLALAGGGLFARRSNASAYYTGPVSDHFDGVRFFNPGGSPPGNFMGLLKWRFNGERATWPENYPSPFPFAKPEPRIDGKDIRVTFVGHASFLIQTAGLNILIDPVWSQRTSPFSFAGPKRVNPPGIRFEDLPPIDLVLVTHNHYDHLDMETLKRLHVAHKPLFITPLGNDAIIRTGVEAARIKVGDWGDVLEIGSVKIHFEPCHHWSARGLNDRRMALWAAFVIETPYGKIYHIGDTGFHDGLNYHAARKKHGEFRLANLPFGAYEPRWFMKGQHQNPAEAVEGMKICGAAHVCGHHWGTVQLTDEAVEAPLVALKAALAEQGIEESRFQPMRPGEVFDVPSA